MDEEITTKEQRKLEVAGSRIEAVGDIEEDEGGIRIEEERKRREEEIGRRKKAMQDDRGNNANTG